MNSKIDFYFRGRPFTISRTHFNMLWADGLIDNHGYWFSDCETVGQATFNQLDLILEGYDTFDGMDERLWRLCGIPNSSSKPSETQDEGPTDIWS